MTICMYGYALYFLKNDIMHVNYFIQTIFDCNSSQNLLITHHVLGMFAQLLDPFA